MYSEVTGDLFCIASQLKQINENYRVFYNNRDGRFEVHTNGLEFVVPYAELDSRTLDYARKTRRENAEVIEAEIGEHNRVIASKAKQSMDKAMITLADMLDFASKKGGDVTFAKTTVF